MAIVGSFQEDLDIYLADYKGRSGASKQSEKDLKGIGSIAKGLLDNGKMYSFEYFTPAETFYDTYPLVLGLGKSDNDHQLGVNIHYIPYDARIPFLSDVFKSFKSTIASAINKAPGNPMAQPMLNEFTYDNLKKSLGRKYNLTYAVRQYRLDRMRKPRMLGYEDWYVGAVNNQNHFFGGNINEAQALYYKNI
mgnify:FL=1